MKAPLFSLPFINKEEEYHLQEDLGKVIVLTFWTSWCPDCARDLPRKEQLFQSMDSDKVKMLTINVSGRERHQAAGLNYFNTYLSQPTLTDNGREVYNLYQCEGVPTTVIIDSDGNINKQFGDKANFLTIVEAIGKLIPNTTN